MDRGRLRAALFLLLLAALTAVLGMRAVRLVSQPKELAGIDERKWFHSAGPVTEAASLGSIRSDLPPGAEVWLMLPPDWETSWWRWMARYHLPEQRIAGVVPQASEAPPNAWVVAVLPEGKAVVERRPR